MNKSKDQTDDEEGFEDDGLAVEGDEKEKNLSIKVEGEEKTEIGHFSKVLSPLQITKPPIFTHRN